MFWVWTGAAFITWEVWADRRGKMKVSEAAHHFPWLLLPIGWLVSLAVHYVLEWLRCRRLNAVA